MANEWFSAVLEERVELWKMEICLGELKTLTHETLLIKLIWKAMVHASRSLPWMFTCFGYSGTSLLLFSLIIFYSRVPWNTAVQVKLSVCSGASRNRHEFAMYVPLFKPKNNGQAHLKPSFCPSCIQICSASSSILDYLLGNSSSRMLKAWANDDGDLAARGSMLEKPMQGMTPSMLARAQPCGGAFSQRPQENNISKQSIERKCRLWNQTKWEISWGLSALIFLDVLSGNSFWAVSPDWLKWL